MIKEVNATPFTKRYHYAVEEVSLEEFMAALDSQSHREKEDDAHLRFIRSRIDTYRN